MDFDGSDAGSSRSASHARVGSDAGPKPAPPTKLSKVDVDDQSAPQAGPSAPKGLVNSAPAPPSLGPLPPPKFVSRHARRQTEHTPVTPSTSVPSATFESVELPPQPERRASGHRRSATVASKSAARRARVSASVFEPPDEEKGDGQLSEAEAFRARIEALRSDMGDGWLKVFNQTQLASPPPPPVASG